MKTKLQFLVISSSTVVVVRLLRDMVKDYTLVCLCLLLNIYVLIARVDGNVFLRDEAHAGHYKLPTYNTTSKVYF